MFTVPFSISGFPERWKFVYTHMGPSSRILDLITAPSALRTKKPPKIRATIAVPVTVTYQ